MKPFNVVFFDLDETLYPKGNGIWRGISVRINSYLQEQLGLPPETAEQIRSEYLETFGTTLNGLMKNFQIDPIKYLDYVHDIPIEDYLHPDPSLRSCLASIAARRVIFTNADRKHALRVLTRLGVDDMFEQIVDILALNWINKPREPAYQQALELCGNPDPSKCVLVDDRIQNIMPAAALGMTTVLVSDEGDNPDACHTIPSVKQLLEVLPVLLDRSE